MIKNKTINILFCSFIYLLMVGEMFLLANLYYKNDYIMIFGIEIYQYEIVLFINILIILLIVLFLKIRRISFKSVYLDFSDHKNNRNGLIIALISSVLIIAFFLIRFFIIDGNESIGFKSISYYLLNLLYILIGVAIYEEFIFHGLFLYSFKNSFGKIASIIIIGIFFMFIHLYSLTYELYDMTLWEMFISKLPNFLSLFSLHVLLSIFTLKCNNIIPAIIIHFVWDFTLLILN